MTDQYIGYPVLFLEMGGSFISFVERGEPRDGHTCRPENGCWCGVHNLDTGDRLEIFDPTNPESPAWSALIDIVNYTKIFDAETVKELTERQLDTWRAVGLQARLTKFDPVAFRAAVAELVEALGPTLTAVIACVRDRDLPRKWTRAEGPRPTARAIVSLLAAHRAWHALVAAESADVARAWFTGLCPLLGDAPPFIAFAQNPRAAEAAAEAFIDNEHDGL